ncbi:CsbD family protein [Savagea serpentis]|nr:CsbD family protein [Savagea serpentis]
MSEFKNKVKGTFNELKGEAKQKLGKAMDDTSMQADGLKDEVKGKAQKKMGEVQGDTKEAYDEAKKDVVNKADELKERYIDKKETK